MQNYRRTMVNELLRLATAAAGADQAARRAEHARASRRAPAIEHQSGNEPPEPSMIPADRKSFDMRAIPEWLWWTMFAGMFVVGWWLSLFPTDLKSLSVLLKTSIAIPADSIGWLLLLAGWSVVLLAAAAMALFLFDRLSSAKARQQAGDPGA